jgi:2-oxoglutarate dehydrogenase E2 component (dihydrolipoamide succinyltransferase)
MSKYELRIPKLGESVIEATITAWLKEVGDFITAEDGVLEVATDKVDTEIPSEVSGILKEKLLNVNDVAKIGEVVAIIETNIEGEIAEEKQEISMEVKNEVEKTLIIPEIENEISKSEQIIFNSVNRYYSPLVKSIAQIENISQEELDSIHGTGQNERVTKEDILYFIKNRENKPETTNLKTDKTIQYVIENKIESEEKENSDFILSMSKEDEVIPMDRMGKLIADHMIKSVQTSAHVQSFIEIDVTNIVNWRTKNKNAYLQKTGENLTYTPIFMQAVAQTIGDYPMVNVSVEGSNIIKKKDINLGMATALPNGNLIVPVIKKADELSLIGMVRTVNKLAENARNNKLSPDDIQGGTYTVTNVGSFGSITGTPIINQPQVAILALGAIRKMPSVIENLEGDSIGIRHKMIVAHSYDHRVINGALGGKFILRLKEILESFDEKTAF